MNLCVAKYIEIHILANNYNELDYVNVHEYHVYEFLSQYNEVIFNLNNPITIYISIMHYT